jgi:hypothetical protein
VIYYYIMCTIFGQCVAHCHILHGGARCVVSRFVGTRVMPRSDSENTVVFTCLHPVNADGTDPEKSQMWNTCVHPQVRLA